MTKIALSDINATIIGGQILSRIVARADKGDEIAERRKVAVPKSINSDGTFNIEEMPTESLKVEADKKKIAEEGDIVIKLSPPFDAALVTEESAGCLVPSFCALIKQDVLLENVYLLAFLNSEPGKQAIYSQVAGLSMTLVSVGKLKSIEIPWPDQGSRREIAIRYLSVQHKLKIMEQIKKLEAKRNDVIFSDLVKLYEH